ncbi:MAG TPA: hypothetical protein VJP02_16655 [Candidatus Sulfotelmatobacter sp.]|nr:hypothetical protein [Candidatus Sulfotelmatobacter sp.]
MVVTCRSNKKFIVGATTSFQIRVDDGPKFIVPMRFDTEIKKVFVSLAGDASNIVAFSGKDGERILASKEVVIQLEEYGGPSHQLLFKPDGSPPLECK